VDSTPFETLHRGYSEKITWFIQFRLTQWSEIFQEKVMMVQNKIMMVQLVKMFIIIFIYIIVCKSLLVINHYMMAVVCLHQSGAANWGRCM
jgi:hypothetical protein